ncbi:2-C-methyl-D-erythritol 4-phosphate cytidylyltransferase [Cellulomonas sp. P24]|uniref:2-C-methyl-D-erythritol 4-phosphate cytidylyltransferase n=1 Tax=Cellulomonas sp. P24 TaxID=2885206 RepID=UPI00286FD16A|nr:2-C-methyl-D-erythritol 4-phosphate cytidylyltransferase [Cellulomonas sp. P24]MCR6493395.1 2-C-methyl-D-erythritol 4-phosphate cytidylyltransferase [Cellulomonas sp. P24]
MTTAAVLTAAGSGSRLGRDDPKALVELRGRPLVVHAARRLVASGVVDVLVVTAPEERVDDVTRLLVAEDLPVPVSVVAGGTNRQASVAAGLALLPREVDVVLIHDAARALLPPALVVRVADAVRAGHRAVIPGVPVHDTIKQVGQVSAGGAPVLATVSRDRLRAVQTPQGFSRELIDRAHIAGLVRAATEATAATDDAALVEAIGVAVWQVDGAEDAFKITTPRDLSVAELLLAETDGADEDARVDVALDALRRREPVQASDHDAPGAAEAPTTEGGADPADGGAVSLDEAAS